MANGRHFKSSYRPRQPVRRAKPDVRLHTLLMSQTIKQITTKVPINPYPNIVFSDLYRTRT